MASLEGWGSAIELHPRLRDDLERPWAALDTVTESGRQDSNLRSSAPKADALAATLRPGRPASAERSRTSVGHTSLPTNPVGWNPPHEVWPA
jgi:hypothetical protein